MHARSRFALRCVAVAALPVVAAAHAAAGVDPGATLEVVPLELPGQAEPSIVADRDGGFVLTWIDRGDGGVAHLRYAVLDRAGGVARRGEIAQGRGWFVNWADFPSLAIADNGDWVSFWLRKTDPVLPYAYEILSVRSTDRGRTWSEPQLMHDDATPTEHGFVSLLPDGDDRVLAVWLDGRRTPVERAAKPALDGGTGTDHEAHAVTALRSAVLTRDHGLQDARELDELVCDCCATDAARTASGPLVVYRNRTADEIRDIAWLERTPQRWPASRIVHADGWRIAGCPVNGPAVAAAEGGAFAAWPTLVDGAYRVRVARRDADGWSAPVELEAAPGVLGRVDVAAWPGGALVSWIGIDAPAGDGGAAPAVLRIARLDDGLGVAERIDVATLPPGRMTGMPRLASSGAHAILVWTSPETRGGKVRGALLRAAHLAARLDTAARLDAARRELER